MTMNRLAKRLERIAKDVEAALVPGNPMGKVEIYFEGENRPTVSASNKINAEGSQLKELSNIVGYNVLEAFYALNVNQEGQIAYVGGDLYFRTDETIYDGYGDYDGPGWFSVGYAGAWDWYYDEETGGWEENDIQTNFGDYTDIYRVFGEEIFNIVDDLRPKQ